MDHISPPNLLLRTFEGRAPIDLASAQISQLTGARKADQSLAAPDNAHPVILFPGFGTGDRAMQPLKGYLESLGHNVFHWGLGRNLAGADLKHKLEDIHPRWDLSLSNEDAPDTYKGEGGVPLLCDRAIEKTAAKARELGTPVVVVGWSLGGVVAREVARSLLDTVSQVVTFGTPVIGGPKYTAAASVYKSRGQNLDWIEREIQKREDSAPINQPITAIYSKLDGVVAWQASIDRNSANAEHIEVSASHLGMGFNRKVWRLVAKALSERRELN